MNVRELIELLQMVEDKDKTVMFAYYENIYGDSYGIVDEVKEEEVHFFAKSSNAVVLR